MLGAGEYKIRWCAPGVEGAEYASFALASAGGETVVRHSGAESESVELPMLEKNTAYAKENGEWTVSHRPTPGYSNDDAGYEAGCARRLRNDEIYITEVMAQNAARSPTATATSPTGSRSQTSARRASILRAGIFDDPDAGRWKILSRRLRRASAW